MPTLSEIYGLDIPENAFTSPPKPQTMDVSSLVFNPYTNSVTNQAGFTNYLSNMGIQNQAPIFLSGGSSSETTNRGKTTAELAAEQAAKNAAINQQKAAYDAQMNQQFSGNFDFLNQPMEVNPFQVVNGQAIMGRPTYGGQPPAVGNYSMSSAFQQRAPQMAPGVNVQSQQNGQVDLGQMYSLFQNPYLAELATLLFGNSSWLK